MGTTRDHPSSQRSPDRKGVLFCPACAHESPVDGDWRRRTAGGDVVYGCPVCGTDVTARPAGSRADEEALLARSVGLAVAPLRVALAWTTWYAGDRRRSRTH